MSDRLPSYHLSIEPDKLDKLNQNLPGKQAKLSQEYKKEVSAIFTFDSIDYPVKVRYRGDDSNHWVYAKKSWRINFI